MTRRALLGSAAAAGMVAATPWPLRALAQGGGGSSIAQAWTTYAQSLVPATASGASYAIVQPNQIDIVKGLGHLSKASDAATTGPHTLFEIGSVTKVFTAILLGLSIDPTVGVTLETELGPFLPEGVNNLAVEQLTFGQLAQYANCLTSNPPGHNNPKYTRQQLTAWLNGANAMQQGCDPGTDYYYSNLAWGLLGYALGQVWKTSWTHLVRDQLALPLGMKDTRRTGTQTHRQLVRTATGYGLNGKKAPPQLGAKFLGGGGELVSTAADMAKFIHWNLNPESAPGALANAIQFAQAGLKTYTEGIQERHKPPPQPLNPPVSAGIGWFAGQTTNLADQSVGWTKDGGTLGFGSFVGIIPAQGVGIFLVANSKKVNANKKGRSVLGLTALNDPG